MAELLMPGEAKPGWERFVDTINLPTVRLMVDDNEPLRAADFDLYAPFAAARTPHLIEARRAAGPAPYVGAPFAYVWEVYVDTVTGRALWASRARACLR